MDGGPCDFSVSPCPFGLVFGTLDFGLGLDSCFFQIIILSSGSFKCKLELRGWCENSFRRTRFLPIVLKVRFCLFWLNDFCTTLRNAFWFTSALNCFSCSFFSSFNSDRKFFVDWVLKTDALILFVLKKASNFQKKNILSNSPIFGWFLWLLDKVPW